MKRDGKIIWLEQWNGTLTSCGGWALCPVSSLHHALTIASTDFFHILGVIYQHLSLQSVNRGFIVKSLSDNS